MARYIEALGTAWGWVWIDAQGFGHRSSAYFPRWKALGGPSSGWNLNADGTFTSQLPIPVHGHPLDPSLPAPPPDLLTEKMAPAALVFGGLFVGYMVLKVLRGRK